MCFSSEHENVLMVEEKNNFSSFGKTIDICYNATYGLEGTKLICDRFPLLPCANCQTLGGLGFFFFFNLFKPLNTFFLCVLCILLSAPGYVQFRIQNMCRERYLLSCQVGTNIIGL